MEIKGKKVLVLGLARTGRECARFLAQRGASVQVTDVRSEEELKQEMETLAALPIRYFLGGEDPDWLEGVDIIVPSPELLLPPFDRPAPGAMNKHRTPRTFYGRHLCTMRRRNECRECGSSRVRQADPPR